MIPKHLFRAGVVTLGFCLTMLAACDRTPRATASPTPEAQAQQAQRALAAGQRAYAQTDFATAFERFREAALEGNANAQYYLGVMYADGQGTQTNFAEAARWYEKAAAQNQPDALYKLARLYAIGLGVNVDGKRAIELYARAAAAYPPGQERDAAEQQRAALAAAVKSGAPAPEHPPPN